MADRWTPPKADEHLRKAPVPHGRPPAPAPTVWPQPCRWQAGLNRRLFGIVLRAAAAGVFLTREQLNSALREKSRLARELREMFGDGRAPEAALKDLDGPYGEALCRAAGIAVKFASRGGPLPMPTPRGDRAMAGRSEGLVANDGLGTGSEGRPGAAPAAGTGGDGPGVPGDAGGAGDDPGDLRWAGLEELEPDLDVARGDVP